ncbi:hypothetical protein PR202_ga09667 [Eleusine coracana subsp. coracana]|uniref:Uncharacterized protein n=1 Tax=Eleusine coracana subsp. coracana TaxID=191504 RepID=A0AAV5C584_ELECO|nr:hypothetical protein QOZ80_1AG0033150 [Eleusine coracana subsp. coracana]GJM93138.1 hypothetical protein PR202_ga09667 [Eleusine coracana subsp. coracana]
MDGDEFQEADVLWPDDTPRDDLLMMSMSPFAPDGLRFDGSPPFFPAGAQASSPAGAILDTEDDEEEWQEADVLWPEDTVVEEPWRGGGGSLWAFRGAFGRAGRRVKPAAAPRREGWAPDVSSPIDIPANVAAAARRLVGAAMGRRRL